MFGTLTKIKRISVIEAHSLWSLISAKYHMQNNVQFWLVHVHDMDLKKILKDFIIDLNEHISLLEKEMSRYSIEAPSRARKQIRADVKSEVISDELIAVNYFTFLQEMVEKVLFSIQYSVFSDKISNFFEKFAKHTIEQTDNILKYLKIKGWIDIPPSYTNIPASINEKLDCIEAFHLWTHTYYRYSNIEETIKWKEFVHDPDFKIILDRGYSKMKKQITLLENELEYFGLPTPKKPPAVVKTNQDQSIFKDEGIFKTLYIGIQWAGILHAQAFKQCVTNDRIRDIFKNLLYEEMKMVKQVSKYGKIKGWLEIPPEYPG